MCTCINMYWIYFLNNFSVYFVEPNHFSDFYRAFLLETLNRFLFYICNFIILFHFLSYKYWLNAIACTASSPRRGLTIVLDLGGTLSSCPAVDLNCIKKILYTTVLVFDRVLIQVCSWVVFEECPLGALAHVPFVYCLFSLLMYKYRCLSLLLCISVLGYIVRLQYFFWTVLCLHVCLICALNYYLTWLLDVFVWQLHHLLYFLHLHFWLLSYTSSTGLVEITVQTLFMLVKINCQFLDTMYSSVSEKVIHSPLLWDIKALPMGRNTSQKMALINKRHTEQGLCEWPTLVVTYVLFCVAFISSFQGKTISAIFCEVLQPIGMAFMSHARLRPMLFIAVL